MLRWMMPYCCMCLMVFPMLGCGPASDRLPVSGAVTLKGVPIDDGIIEFSSATSRTGAPISKGKYDVSADQGLPPGVYKVVITAGDGKTPADSPDGLPGPTGANIVSKDRIPPEYGSNSKQEVTVSKKGPNKFDLPYHSVCWPSKGSRHFPSAVSLRFVNDCGRHTECACYYWTDVPM